MKAFFQSVIVCLLLYFPFGVFAADKTFLESSTDPETGYGWDSYLDKTAVKERGEWIFYDVIYDFFEPHTTFGFTWALWRISVKLQCENQQRFMVTRVQAFSGPMASGKTQEFIKVFGKKWKKGNELKDNFFGVKMLCKWR